MNIIITPCVFIAKIFQHSSHFVFQNILTQVVEIFIGHFSNIYIFLSELIFWACIVMENNSFPQ